MTSSAVALWAEQQAMAGAPSMPLSSESKGNVAFRVDINATCHRASMIVSEHYGADGCIRKRLDGRRIYANIEVEVW